VKRLRQGIPDVTNWRSPLAGLAIGAPDDFSVSTGVSLGVSIRVSLHTAQIGGPVL